MSDVFKELTDLVVGGSRDLRMENRQLRQEEEEWRRKVHYLEMEVNILRSQLAEVENLKQEIARYKDILG